MCHNLKQNSSKIPENCDFRGVVVAPVFTIIWMSFVIDNITTLDSRFVCRHPHGSIPGLLSCWEIMFRVEKKFSWDISGWDIFGMGWDILEIFLRYFQAWDISLRYCTNLRYFLRYLLKLEIFSWDIYKVEIFLEIFVKVAWDILLQAWDIFLQAWDICLIYFSSLR